MDLRTLQQHKGPQNVALGEGKGVSELYLRGEVHDSVDLLLLKHVADRFRGTNVAPHDLVAFIVLDLVQFLQAGAIVQSVQAHLERNERLEVGDNQPLKQQEATKQHTRFGPARARMWQDHSHGAREEGEGGMVDHTRMPRSGVCYQNREGLTILYVGNFLTRRRTTCEALYCMKGGGDT